MNISKHTSFCRAFTKGSFKKNFLKILFYESICTFLKAARVRTKFFGIFKSWTKSKIHSSEQNLVLFFSRIHAARMLIWTSLHLVIGGEGCCGLIVLGWEERNTFSYTKGDIKLISHPLEQMTPICLWHVDMWKSYKDWMSPFLLFIRLSCFHCCLHVCFHVCWLLNGNTAL